jgi:hypothetical protein
MYHRLRHAGSTRVALVLSTNYHDIRNKLNLSIVHREKSIIDEMAINQRNGLIAYHKNAKDEKVDVYIENFNFNP